MRNRDSWHQQVSRDLNRVWREIPTELGDVKPALLCQVELTLRVLERIAPHEPAAGAYTLLAGYSFAKAAGLSVTPDHEVMLTAVRHRVWTLRRRRTWQQALETYQALPERMRAYLVPEESGPVRPIRPTIASDRLAVYDAALATLPDFDRRRLRLAPPGRSTFIERRRPTSVTFPAELRPDPTPGHDLAAARAGDGAAIRLTRADLAETAQWMDRTEIAADAPKRGHWEQRLAELRLAPRSADGRSFTDSDELHLDGMLHLVGMVGAGKSTLMTLVAVWATQRGMRTTLVVGDVAEQLRLSALLRGLGLPATPVLGPTTRETHVQRLHRRLAARGLDNLLDHDDPGFDDLSTACMVDALRGTEAAEPLRYADAPCTSLHPEQVGETDRAVTDEAEPIAIPEPYRPGGTTTTPSVGNRPAGQKHGCPLWSTCPRHRTARELVESLIWIANPASLVQSSVPHHLNEERLRYLELACLRSDIVIVDEADSVQMKFDEIFAPSATLVMPSLESWLDQLHTHKIEELSRQGRLPLTDQEVARWSASLAAVTTATDRLYKKLIADGDVRDWADPEYFSPWTLQEKLLTDWFEPNGSPTTPDGVRDEDELFEAYENDDPEPEPASPAVQSRRAELTAVFDRFRDDPLGGNGPYADPTDDLVALTQDLLNTLSDSSTRRRVVAVLTAFLAGTPAPADDPKWLDATAGRVEFMLLLSALNQRLERLTFLWPQVEAALHLDSTGNDFSRRPPLDYAPLVPEAPMGNVLGFQYLPDERERDESGRHSGTLRFFRCAGVGRELLLSLHELGSNPATGRPGPQVVLMSGTSWAGKSTRAHVLAPVGAVLKPSERSLTAVRRSVFRTHFLYDDNGKPISLSGTDTKNRLTVARAMASILGSPGRGHSPSPLEEELALVDDDDRRRAILLAGSYKEANAIADTLHGIERWHGRVRVLAADDADLDQAVRGGGPVPGPAGHATALRRGDLAAFAEDPRAEVLVAPLMAVERGHNILNAQRNAAFGTALFLARPHPRPDDLALAIFAINDWVSRFVRDQPGLDQGTFTALVNQAGTLDAAGLAFRHVARREWRRLLARRYIYSRLSEAEKQAFVWDQLVTIWQVIGRLVRGGVPARVVFVDARFAPRLARSLAPGIQTNSLPSDDGLLPRLRTVLAPYFDQHADPARFPDPGDPALARLLYQPLFEALTDLTHHRS
ncbi:hypothetical protein ABTY61_31110 [Kitasatospora sp. NPDC096128]|uniref:pPIWI_RE_Z domain-containing protein n=1 Tax=Kitasatospora sp. NPDC096128 TaxID=3155547 RepID=UPI0033226653